MRGTFWNTLHLMQDTTRLIGSFAAVSFLLVAVTRCATTAGATTAGAPTADYAPLGSFEFHGAGASFNATRVVGSHINVGQRSDGTWAGVVMNKTFDVSVTPGGIRGVGTTITWQDTPTGVIVDGLFYGRLMHFEVDQEQFRAQVGGRFGGFQVRRVDRENFVGGLTLRGLALDLHPPEPQFALALLAGFR
jgi:hypothetical protein